VPGGHVSKGDTGPQAFSEVWGPGCYLMNRALIGYL
jgi:hypothetical protein